MERDDDVMVNKSLVNKEFILWLRHFISCMNEARNPKRARCLDTL